MSWKVVAHWLAGSAMLFMAVFIVSVSTGETAAFGWMISLLLFLTGGLFWITASKDLFAKEIGKAPSSCIREED